MTAGLPSLPPEALRVSRFSDAPAPSLADRPTEVGSCGIARISMYMRARVSVHLSACTQLASLCPSASPHCLSLLFLCAFVYYWLDSNPTFVVDA